MKHIIENIKSKYREFKWWLKWNEEEVFFIGIVIITLPITYFLTRMGG